MQSKTNISQAASELLLETQELELKKTKIVEELKVLQPRYDRFIQALTYGKTREEDINHWEKKLYGYFRTPTVSLKTFADFIHIDEGHLRDLIEERWVAFEYTYFPSSPDGDYIFVTLESMARFIVDHTVNSWTEDK
jgi:hypothetical protein